MKYATTFKELDEITREFSEFRLAFPNVAKVLGNRFSTFDNSNSVYIGILTKESQKLMSEHVVVENGMFQTVKDEAGNAKWKFIDDEHKAAFEKAYAELMNRPCTIIL